MGDRSQRITVRKAKPGPEDDRLDREFRESIPPADRVEEARQLTLELWELKGWDPGEPGLHRTVARIVHR